MSIEQAEHFKSLGIDPQVADLMAETTAHPDERFVTATEAFWGFVEWDTTPQGHGFWSKKLREYCASTWK